jgi:hypothetical protein
MSWGNEGNNDHREAAYLNQLGLLSQANFVGLSVNNDQREEAYTSPIRLLGQAKIRRAFSKQRPTGGGS